MFTGIIEALGQIVALEVEGSNHTLSVTSPFAAELRVDQSLAHNGVCLTVTGIQGHTHTVTAVEETLKKTNLGNWNVGDWVNLERCTTVGSRLDGHIVQGHVDTVGICRRVEERDGSWLFDFQFPTAFAPLLVEKGSICINGTSLTVFAVGVDTFRVTIIPYTWENTTFQYLKAGHAVNLEFDIVGKYVNRWNDLKSQGWQG